MFLAAPCHFVTSALLPPYCLFVAPTVVLFFMYSPKAYTLILNGPT
jgi:hypothetical protein